MITDGIELTGWELTQLLLERSTATQLDQNIRTAFPNTRARQHLAPSVTLDSIAFTPYVGVNMLHVKSTTGQHQQAIQFMGVQFVPAQADGTATVVASDDGRDYYFKPIVLSAHMAKVRCSCLDFRFRFAAYNNTDQSLIGRAPPPYTRKTNRPPVNPNQVPGICKHLIRVLDELEADGVVTV